MSQFSVLLSEFIKNSPYSIKKLSHECNVNRTVIQKYLSGERLPNNYKNIEKIIDQLTLNNKQKETLRKAYNIEKIGFDNYQHFIKLKQLIENIKIIDSYKMDISYYFDKINLIANNLEELTTLTHFIIHDVLTSNSHKIKLYIPTNNELYTTIMNSFYLTQSISIEQILHLENDQKNQENMINLIQFENCLSSLFFHNVSIKYIYDNFISTLSYYNSYPYMIHSEHYSLVIDSKLSSGALLSHKMAENLNNQFDKMFLIANSYNSTYLSLFGFLYYHQNSNYSIHNNYYVFTNEPSILSIVDNDLFDRHFIGEKKDYEIIKKYFLNYKNYIHNLTLSNQLHIYLTKNGLQKFIQTGLTHEFPKKHMSPLSKKEAIFLLKRLINIASNNENYQLHLINENYFTLPQRCLIAYQDNQDVMILIDNEDKNRCIFINEPTIQKDFYNFIQIIAIEECEYDKSYTNAYFKQLLENND